jgi:hypothetical protein
MRRQPTASVSRPRRWLALGAALTVLALLSAGCLFGSGSPTPVATGTPGPGSPTSAPGSVVPSSSEAPASGTPAPVPTGLAAGVYAQVVVDGLNVRVNPKSDATPIGQLFFGDVVLVRSDAGVVAGVHWYEIETYQTVNDQRLIGYVAGAASGQSYLQPLAGKPSPTPSPTPTPVLTPSPSSAPTASAS